MPNRGLSRTQMLAAPTVHVFCELPLPNRTTVSISLREKTGHYFVGVKLKIPTKVVLMGHTHHNVDKEIYN